MQKKNPKEIRKQHERINRLKIFLQLFKRSEKSGKIEKSGGDRKIEKWTLKIENSIEKKIEKAREIGKNWIISENQEI